MTNPMDVIKTRLMTATTTSGDLTGVTPRELTVSGVCASIVQEEGMGAFMKGVVPRLLHKMPANSIFFLSYEAFRKLLNVTK